MNQTKEHTEPFKRKVGEHPCFNSGVKEKLGRVHLPVAPGCNIRCNYCNRLFDCSNESRPGVTSKVIDPAEAVDVLKKAMDRCQISVAGIAGPGDPLANPELTLETLSLVKKAFPRLLLCLSTNGLAAPDLLEEIVTSGVSHVTLTVNAVDPRIGARIYRWIRLGGQTTVGVPGAELLLRRQIETIAKLKESGLVVKVNTVVIPGVNDHHVAEIAEVMGSLSVDLHNSMPLYPVAGTPFAGLPEPSPENMRLIRRRAAAYLPQMSHCARCRADASGLLGEDHPGRRSGRRCASLLAP